MNKKITSSALAALMIAGTTSFSALAAMSNGTVVIGTKAFALAYANDPANAAVITNAIVAGGTVYIKNFDGKWINNATGATVDASVIPAVTYTNASGVVTAFDAADKDVVASSMEVTMVGIKAVQVKFNKAVDTSKVNLQVKKGAAIYGSTVVWNEAKTIATLTAVVNLPAADYTVEATGVTATTLTKAFTVSAEAASKIEVTSTTVALVASPTVTFKVSNQYGEDMKINGTTAGVVVSAYNTTQKKAQTITNLTADNKLTFNAGFATTGNAELAKLGDVIRVTVAYAGITAQTNVTVVDQASNATIAFGDIAPLKDTTRISINQAGIVVPYVMADQFGVASKFTANRGANADGVANIETIDGVQFTSSNPSVINVDKFKVDANNKLTFDTDVTNSGTAIITAVINASGAVASFSVTVNGTAKVDSLVISAPTALVAAKETVKLDVNAVDQFGAVIAAKDIAGVTVTSSNTSVVADGSTITAGKLNVATLAAGTTVLTAKVGTKTVGTVTVVVEAEAKATQINSIKFGPKFELGATKTLTTSDFVVVDQYGRAMDKANITFTVAEKTIADTQFAIANAKDFTAAAVGSSVMVLTATDANGVVAVPSEFTLEVINSADITSYSITAVPTMFNDAAHAKVIELVGKTASGDTIMLKGNKITHATTSNATVALVATASGVVTVTGGSSTADGTAVIAVWGGTTKLAETTVTVSKVAPVVTTAKFNDTVETALASGITLLDNLEVKDQYGVVKSDAGFWTTSDDTKATVSNGVVTMVGTPATGDKVTIGYVTTNGIVVTTVLTK